jgi:NADH-quinone oxidoreductase subunit L
MADLLFLIPVLPLAAFLINILLGKSFLKVNTHWVALPAVLASWVLSILVFLDIRDKDEAINQRLFTWIPSGNFHVDVSLHADQLTAIMLLVVTTVGFLVHLYSVGYMKDDPGYYRFFSYLPLFVFSMLMLVLADNLLLLFVFWEAVGLCSYFLIGYYFRRRSASNAAKKAFIVNRIGDLGFGLGIMLIFWTFGTVNLYGENGIFAKVENYQALGIAGGTLTLIGILLFIGACGKSAQFPLHVWLPDAMEGPTPVSALIHAATMVTAGIYMVARTHSIYMQSETAMLFVACIGAFTAFMAATIALTQNDIKRVVAYSTLSQLGYMAFALGTGAWMAAIFHLMTHAFFKALLFLGCGSVIHGMHEEQDIRNMGGLRTKMPLTFWTFLIGALANAGVVPLAGFWSKDEIIVGSWVGDSDIGKLAAIVGLLAAFLTALYMFRLVFLVFFGKPRYDTAHVHPHESKWPMALPLVLLAVPSLLIGFVGFPPEKGPFHKFLEPVFYPEVEAESHASTSLYVLADSTAEADHATEGEHGEGTAAAGAEEGDHGATEGEHAEAAGGHAAGPHHVSTAMTWTFGVISTLVALSGIGVAYLIYIRGTISAAALAERFPGLYRFLLNKWYFDELYQALFVKPLAQLSYFLWKGMVVLVGVYLAGFSNLFR